METKSNSNEVQITLHEEKGIGMANFTCTLHNKKYTVIMRESCTAARVNEQNKVSLKRALHMRASTDVLTSFLQKNFPNQKS